MLKGGGLTTTPPLAYALVPEDTSLHKPEKSKNTEKEPPRRWCICQSIYEGELMVACETCEEWFHPKCVFDDACAVSLTRGQWKDKNVVCNDAVLSTKIDIRHYQSVPPSHC